MAILFALSFTSMFGQNQTKQSSETSTERKFSVSTSWLSFANFGEEKTNTHHYELHVGYQLTPKDRIGIKAATWKLFAPMGMPMKEQLKFDEVNFYPGRLRENGLGVTYQRKLWKGLFASVEVLPQLKTYLDENGTKIGNGFKLYTSYHLGYQISFFKDLFYLEPQVHCQYWPIDTNTPQSFKEMDDKWNNYFLFEPNLYIGFKF
ncbi:MAG TPA: hypothetical protein DCX89_03555 [Saprospirales bacterium]|nr:hypothetical protein [Saprospirales bacterium]HRQ29260.1 hypothetical protein [Saprospiraceae bacterium]